MPAPTLTYVHGQRTRALKAFAGSGILRFVEGMSETLTTVPPNIDTTMVGVVLGNYRITAPLSGGGMGTVYRARHELLDRPAAIKLLRPELTENDDLVQRFFNEAKAATAIRHPGIVEVYDFGYTAAGHAYLVMEFLDGAPLSKVIAERKRFPEHEAASIARSMASALKAAHAKGIIHRDLKPDNVFLIPDPDGLEARVKILDFGIAKLTTPSSDRKRTMTGVLLGTPKYMAPEQAREAGTIDQRADLYSLGCMLYELLVGRPPFVAEGAGEIIAMQMFNEPEPPSRTVTVSPEMEAIVMKLLEKEPHARYETASQVMEALVAAGARQSRPRGAIAEARPHVERSRSLAIPAALATAVIVAIAVVIAMVMRRDDAAAPPVQPPVASPAPAMPAPAPAPTPPAVVETAAVTPPPPAAPVVKKKPVVKSSAKIVPQAPAPTPEVQAPPTTTDKGSPIEPGLDDSPKKSP